MDEIARGYGFGSWEEMSRMIAEAPIDTPARLAAFERWKVADGTRAGLLALMEAANDAERAA